MHYEKFQDGTVKCIEDEIPFEVPEGWAWARVSSIVQIYLGLTHTPDYVNKGVPFYSVKDISSGGLDTSNPKYISEEEFDNFPSGAKPQKGDILFGRVGTLGKPTVVEIEEPFGIFVSLGFFRKIYEDFSSEYIMNWMDSSLFWNQVSVNVKGAVLTNLNTGWLSRFLIPIPPIREQVKISDYVKVLLAKTNFISTTEEELIYLVTATKSKILDLAIRGKLVPQDPNDEPASVLLERIRSEKEELIKQGKIKREKKESVIFKGDDNSYYEKIDGEVSCIDEEIPYDIPDTWTWMRLENCCVKEIRRGKSPKYAEISNVIVFAQKCNTKYNGIDISLAQYLDETTIKRYPTDEHMQDGDIVINSTGTGTLGRVGIYRNTDNITGLLIVPDSHVTVIRSFSCISSHYLYAFMKAHQTELEKKGEGSTNQKELKPLTLKEMLIAVPPLSEQKRIDKSINVAFSHLAIIEKCLN